MHHLLLIEDDSDIQNMLQTFLTQHDFTLDAAYSGTEGRLLLERHHYDLVLLDLMLPGLDGEALLGEIRQQQLAPVIILSAKDAIDLRVSLLEGGADDYLIKPFDLNELLARIHVVLRRHQAPNPRTRHVIQVGPLKYQQDAHQICYRDQAIDLTVQERHILGLLMAHPQRIFSKQDIFEVAWQTDYFGEDKTLNVHISHIRKKLKEFDSHEWIETVWGVGYRLNPPQNGTT